MNREKMITTPTQNLMPLVMAFFDDHYRDFYFFMSIVRHNMYFLSVDFLQGGNTSNTTLILSSAKGKPEQLKSSRGFAKTWNNTFNHIKNGQVILEMPPECGYTALIPHTLWDGFIEDFKDKRSNELNSWCRLFFYLYWCIKSGYRFQSVFDMAAALGACTKDTSHRIIELENRGWIRRSSYSSQASLARVYGISDRVQKLIASAEENLYNYNVEGGK